MPIDETEGTFSFTTQESGDYHLCIKNYDIWNGGDVTNKLIAFNFRSLQANNQDYQYLGIDTELSELRHGLNYLKDHQSYMNQREDVHKTVVDSINNKVLFWTFLEAIILIGMTIWQISYISNFFEVKRRL